MPPKQSFPKDIGHGTISPASRIEKKKMIAKKGFSKYVSRDMEIVIGTLVLLMIISPAIFFTISLLVPYYTLTPSGCQQTIVATRAQFGFSNGTGYNDGGNAQLLPLQIYYNEVSDINNIANDKTFGQLFGKEWNMWLGQGLCPDGKDLNWKSWQKPTTTPFDQTQIPVQKSIGSNDCVSWRDKQNPTVWTNIDRYNELTQNQGITTKATGDMNQGARNFEQAYNLSVGGCVFAWLLIFYSVYDAIHTEDLIEGHAGMTFSDMVDGDGLEEEDDGRHSIAPFAMDNSSQNEDEEDHEIVSQMITKHFEDHGLSAINVHALNRIQEEEDNTKTFTDKIALEFSIFLCLFGFAVSVIKLLYESDLTISEPSWAGLFPSCTFKVGFGPGIGLLYYQCVSMGMYTLTMFLAELYYVTKYFSQCMRNFFTHPDEIVLDTLHKERDGIEVKEDKWAGPVFLSRIHLTKVRTIKMLWSLVANKPTTSRTPLYYDGFQNISKERTIHDVRAPVLQRGPAPGAPPARKPPVKKTATANSTAPESKEPKKSTENFEL